MRTASVSVALAAGWSLFTAPGFAQSEPPARSDGLPDFEFPFQSQPKPKAHPCPARCDDAGPVPFSWPAFQRTRAFSKCNDTIIFSLSLDKAAADPVIRACSVPGNSITPSQNKYGPVCLPSVKLQNAVANVEVSWETQDAGDDDAASDIRTGLQHLRKILLEDSTCDAISLLAKSGDTVLGLYVGSELRKSSAGPILERFAEVAGEKDRPRRKASAQICGPAGKRSAVHTFGVMYDTTGAIDTVRDALAQWAKAKCLSRFDSSETWKDAELKIIPAIAMTMGPDAVLSNANSASSKSTTRRHLSPDQSPNPATYPFTTLAPRADCTVARVESGDGCWSMAKQKCSPPIELSDLYKYNGGSDKICDNLRAGDYVCCTSGTMPNMDPKPNPDGTCKYVQVQQGDSCDSIAEGRCPERLSLDQLAKFNGGSQSFCTNLKLKSVVCCSQGTKPDLRPKKNPDGTCATHVVKKDELCVDIEENYLLEKGDIEKFNQKKTWAFSNCRRLKENMIICISDGNAPMPAAIHNAVCGPQKLGTVRPTNGTKLADLNPCPLNVCCNVWGQCGTTKDFCIDTSIDGAPGTSKNGTNGCISNCGMDIVNNKQAPVKFERIGYFEAWNHNRPCLNMDVTEVTDPHTIIHFAFGWINEDFTVSVKDVEEQFDKFVKMDTKLKKIMSYGGWAFSNEFPTSHIIRQGVRPENRVAFANNVVDFVNKHNLDGVDFDWEYPGADDIEGSDPGTEEDGNNYLEFLKMLKRRLPGKTVSFAAPASYWYLRHFPIAEIAKVVDYIVYMTYDLHGQWDVGNRYAAEGCELGNCLRSHINKTSTENSLAMITKAGVPSYKVFVGISSYGRSFKMAEPGCDGVSCLYLGERNESPVAPGYCTNTSGYISNAEINQIKNIYNSLGGEYYEYYDEESDTDVLVYDNTEWVAYMDDETKEKRVQWYKDLNFGGVSDWAVDLQAEGKANSADLEIDAMDLSYKCELKNYDNLDDVIKDVDKSAGQCVAMNAIDALQSMLTKSLEGYEDAASGYDDVFGFYRDYMHETLGDRLRALMLYDDQPLANFFECYYDIGVGGKRDEASKYDCKNPPTGYMQSYTFWWELRDRDGFNKTVSNKHGIDMEWIEFGRWEHFTPCVDTGGGSGNDLCTDVKKVHLGFPTAKENFEVPNPKKVVDEARKNFDTMMEQYSDMYMMLGLDTFEGSPADAVEVLAMPVFLLEDAVASMKEVKKIGQEERDRKKKEFILKILEGILFLIPFVGAAIGGLGRTGAALARMLMAIDATGSAGLAVYSLVEDPSMAPVAILAMVLGGVGAGGTRGAQRYRDLALAKGKLTSGQKNDLGASFRRNNPKVETLTAKICPRR
ncbi:hypothetical protein VTJ49DRAFT_3092 [Mycothermus thermophilus]|uniref:chitinase n=1 Tax=Humicola insolens TaxID=85995 RepID=A0ABR3V8N9_HUMIN